MTTISHFAQLTATRQVLVRLCQTIDYGEIQELHVREGEPYFNPRPIVFQDIKLDKDGGERPECELNDFALSEEVSRLLRQLDEVGSGCIDRIVVAAGIPRRVVIRRSLTEAP